MSEQAEFNRTKIEEAQEKREQAIISESDDSYPNIVQAMTYMRRIIRADFDRSDLTSATKLDIIKHARTLGYGVLADQMKADL